MRILYIHASFVPPPLNAANDRFVILSKTLEGDVLQPVWFASPAEVQADFGAEAYPVYQRGRFRYHWFLAWRYNGLRRKLAILRFYIQRGRELCRQQRYDAIVVYSHMTTGLMAVILKLLTGVPVIIEIVTAPNLVCITERAQPSVLDRIRKLYSDLNLHITVLLSNRTHLLYTSQLQPYAMLRNRPSSVFHEFVPVSAVPHRDPSQEEPTILIVGAPWYLKGIDLLVKAFSHLVQERPDLQLKILGYYPDKAALEELTMKIPQIEILKAVPNPEALKLISQSMVFVLPSRCEGQPRVLLEAMAAGVPVVGSDVGGIPELVRDGKDGFVIPSGDANMLEERLRQLIADAGLRARLGASGYERAHSQMNEQLYVTHFTEMVWAVTRRD